MYLDGAADEERRSGRRHHALAAAVRLVDVLPEFLVERIAERNQNGQEKDHPDPDLLAQHLVGLGHPGQEIDQVAYHRVVLHRRERAPPDNLEPDALDHVAVPVLDRPALHVPAYIFDQHAVALELPEHMRHADAREYRIVPAGRAVRIAVVTAKIAPEPISAARARYQRQIGRGPEPVRGVLLGHGDIHHLADLVGGKHQVVLDLLRSEPDVPEPVVAHQGGTVAVQAVVHERTRAGLQARRVAHVDRGRLEPDLGPRWL